MSVKYSYAEFNTYPNCLRTKHQSNTHYKIGKTLRGRLSMYSHVLIVIFLIKQPFFLSRILRKPDFCICENKGADQRAVTAQLCSNCTADQRICFCYTDSSSSSKIRNFKLLAIVCGCTDWFVSDLVGNPEGQFFSRRGSFHLVFSEVRLQGCR